jgi:hypothetical protein
MKAVLVDAGTGEPLEIVQTDPLMWAPTRSLVVLIQHGSRTRWVDASEPTEASAPETLTLTYVAGRSSPGGPVLHILNADGAVDGLRLAYTAMPDVRDRDAVAAWSKARGLRENVLEAIR